MPTPDEITRMKHSILLAIAMNRRFRWFTPAELQFCGRVPYEPHATAVWDEAVKQLMAEKKIGLGRLVVGGWEMPMLCALDDAALPTEEARQLLQLGWRTARERGQVFDEKEFVPKIRIPLNYHPDLAIPPIPETAA